MQNDFGIIIFLYSLLDYNNNYANTLSGRLYQYARDKPTGNIADPICFFVDKEQY